MNRRQFISNTAIIAAGSALFLEFPSFAKAIAEKGLPNLKMGILSDIHLSTPESAATFRHALEYFRDKGVDGVLIAGDMADHGLESQLKVVGDTWFSVFPGNKAPDGRRVEPVFIYGNHDVNRWGSIRERFGTQEEYEKDAIVCHPAESWKACFREEYSRIYMKTVKGYNFIGFHWDNDHLNGDGLAEFLGSRHSKLKGDKPFFYFQHPHPLNTCNGSWAWDPDDGTVTEILSHYPNCVAFSGHTHDPLTDERDLWQGSFTSIGTSSLSYQCLIGARENSYVDGGPEEDSEMKEIPTSDGRHGMLMYVYDDCIAIEKREFVYDEPLRDNWIIPLGVPGAPMSFENRAKTAQIPQFKPSDKVVLTRAEGEDRHGNVHKQITVHFPSVLKMTHGVRAFDYEVKVEARYVDIYTEDATKHVYSPKCYLGEKQDTGEVTCVFAESELPQHHEVRFAVRPCECFGGKGKPIYSEWVPAQTNNQ